MNRIPVYPACRLCTLSVFEKENIKCNPISVTLCAKLTSACYLIRKKGLYPKKWKREKLTDTPLHGRRGDVDLQVLVPDKVPHGNKV